MRASLIKAAPKVTPIGGLSPAVREMSNIVSALNGNGYNQQLSRDRKDVNFEDGQFAPLNPVAPYPMDVPGPKGPPEPRRWQYPVGYNLPTQPGAQKLVDFTTLRMLADLHGVTRRCIEIRKSEIANADWEITARSRSKDDGKKASDDTATQKDIERIARFFERPDPFAGLSFGSWIKQVLEEVLVVDALSVYIHPTWDQSQMYGLEVLDGTTIKPLIDIRGVRPQPPAPAYQQFLYGYPRSEFSSSQELPQDLDPDTLRASGIVTQFTADTLLYKPMTTRAWTPYGFPPVEQIILAINLALKREQWHLAYFTDSNVPAGLIHAPETWTPGQIQQYQEAFDALLQGDVTWKRKIKVVPGGDKFEQIKPPTHEMDFDHYLIRMVCLGLDVMPDEIGFPPETGLGGSGFAQAQAAIARRKSLVPMQRWLKTELLDHLIATQFGRPDLQWRWKDLEHDDSAAQETIDKAQVEDGRKTLNEWRRENDLEPYDIPEADEPFILTMSGPVFLKDQIANQEEDRQMAKQQATVDQQTAKTQMQVAKNPPKDPNKQPPARPSAAKLADLHAWKRKALKAVKDGKAASVAFTSEHIGAAESAQITARLAQATDVPGVVAVFKAAEAAPTKPATVVIIRHPKTALNANADSEDGSPERLRGWIDVPPSAQGKADASAMRDELCDKFDFDKVFSSDLQRACYLARLIGNSSGTKPEESIAWRPWDLGHLAGKPITPEVIAEMKDAVRNPDAVVPGGESFQSFLDRALPAIRAALDFAQTDGKTVAIVTHTRNIRVICDWLAGDQSGTDIKPKVILGKDDPVLPGGYLVLTNNGSGRWKIDRGQSNEEDGAGDDAPTASTKVVEANHHPEWLTRDGDTLEGALRQLARGTVERHLAEVEAQDPTRP